MAIRVYDNGSLYSVSFGEDEIEGFMDSWPCSGLHGLRNVWAQFEKGSGDLVDLECNRRHGAGRFDGAAMVALVDDMQREAIRRKGKALGVESHLERFAS